MPFRRRRAKKSRSTAVKALKLARRAWAAQDHETKLVDDDFNFFRIQSTASAVTLLVNGIPEGTGRDDRIGERVSLKMLDLRLTFVKDPAQVAPTELIRFLVIWDRQPNGGLATVGQILEDVAFVNSRTSMLSPFDINNSKRFQILLDRTFSLNDGDVSEKSVHWRVKLRHKTPQYNGAGATIAQINTGSLLMLPLGAELAVGSETVLSGQLRLTFVG